MAFAGEVFATDELLSATGPARRQVICWCLASLMPLCIHGMIHGQSPGQSGRVPTFMPVTPVSPDFRMQVASASTTIPRGVWEQLDRAGWQVGLARFVVDADPSLTGQRPRGWPENLSWENTDGVNLPGKRMVVLGEKRRVRSGDVVLSSRVAAVLRHEVGHAVDMILGGGSSTFSARPEFISQFRRDVARIPPEQRAALTYYLQTSKAGRQEAFAEAFSIALGGGTDQPNRNRFPRYFPHVMRLVRRHISQLRSTSSGMLLSSSP